MKKLLLSLFSFSSIALFAQNGTCIPSIGVDCVTIPNFIDSATTTFAVMNFTNNGTDCNTQDQNYADYQNKIAGEQAGGSFNLHVGLNHSLPAYLAVWVDWNDDLTFSSGEQIFLPSGLTVMENIAVNVPLTAVTDTVIMRIRCSPVSSMGPCDSVGAGETEDYRLIVLDPTGINRVEHFTWNISPNPAEDLLVIEMEKEFAEISVFDLLGNEVLRMISENGKSTIDVSVLPRGAYFVRVSAEGKSSVKKFVH
jgi:hypothetical protein